MIGEKRWLVCMRGSHYVLPYMWCKAARGFKVLPRVRCSACFGSSFANEAGYFRAPAGCIDCRFGGVSSAPTPSPPLLSEALCLCWSLRLQHSFRSGRAIPPPQLRFRTVRSRSTMSWRMVSAIGSSTVTMVRRLSSLATWGMREERSYPCTKACCARMARTIKERSGRSRISKRSMTDSSLGRNIIPIYASSFLLVLPRVRSKVAGISSLRLRVAQGGQEHN